MFAIEQILADTIFIKYLRNKKKNKEKVLAKGWKARFI